MNDHPTTPSTLHMHTFSDVTPEVHYLADINKVIVSVGDSASIHLTPADALKLSDDLVAGVDAADGHWVPEAVSVR